MLKSWRTTILGVLAIIGSIPLLYHGITSGDQTMLTSGGTSLATGIGLLCAKDSSVTGIGKNATTDVTKDGTK